MSLNAEINATYYTEKELLIAQKLSGRVPVAVLLLTLINASPDSVLSHFRRPVRLSLSAGAVY